MGNRTSMPRRLWWLVLGLSLALHLLVVSLLPPILPRMPEVDPLQRDIRVAFPQPEPEPEQEPEESEPPEPPEPEPEPEKEPEPDEQHMPRDTDEVTDLDGTSMDAPEAEEEPAAAPEDPRAAGDAPSPETSETPSRPESTEDSQEGEGEQPEPESGAPSPDAATQGEARNEPDPDSASMSLGRETEEPETAPESGKGPEIGTDTGMEALDEGEMDAIRGESMVSEIEERRIRMANEYLARMKRQIMARWEQPEGADARHRGEIRFSVDAQGYLETSRVHLPSGHSGLDESALRAVRSVGRYRVPDSPAIVRRYYQNLRFTYSGEPLNNDD
ncbi:TonB family protein [Halospina sp. K52047b]|uniref:TonB family protein n=1 Tax=Halospina sp. K52047b TaxID=2614160 RepID=UPI00124AAA7F|nr:TonB family protein [Halospina sp. K52047b]KAA8984291.1 TonB C-terminal domain-containing protein [Halospina sp. K52047b]